MIRTNIPWQHLMHPLPLWWIETLVLYYVLPRERLSHMVPKPECKYGSSRFSWELHKEEEIKFFLKLTMYMFHRLLAMCMNTNTNVLHQFVNHVLKETRGGRIPK
jgi:hypothetical protein